MDIIVIIVCESRTGYGGLFPETRLSQILILKFPSAIAAYEWLGENGFEPPVREEYPAHVLPAGGQLIVDDPSVPGGQRTVKADCFIAVVVEDPVSGWHTYMEVSDPSSLVALSPAAD